MCVCVCRKEGIDVRVVKRGEYNEEVVRWADAIISAGGKNLDHLVSLFSVLCTPAAVILKNQPQCLFVSN